MKKINFQQLKTAFRAEVWRGRHKKNFMAQADYLAIALLNVLLISQLDWTSVGFSVRDYGNDGFALLIFEEQ